MTFTSGEIEGIPVNLVRTFSDMENRVMARIVETLKNNGADITRAVDWQLHRLNELGKTDKDIKESIQRALDLSDEEIDKVYSDTLQESYLRDRTLYENMGQPFIPYDENLELKQLVSAVIHQTKKECRNITQSLGFAKKQPDGKIIYTSLGDFYRDKLDSGLMEIATGITDYNTVLNRVVSEMTNSGMRWIDYESGWSNRVDVACRRALLTGYNQIVAKVNEDNAENLGTEHFEVSYHSGARPTHQVWQGRVYTKKQLETVCGLGTVTGLMGANCYHSYSPFIVGVDERTYTDEELDRMNAEDNTPKEYNGKQYTKYEALQRQRRLETTMRAERQKINRLIQGGADEDDIISAKVRYNGTSDEYVKFSRAMGLPQQRQRVTVDGLRNIGDNKKQKSINISGTKTVEKSAESGIINNKVTVDANDISIIAKSSPTIEDTKEFLDLLNNNPNDNIKKTYKNYTAKLGSVKYDLSEGYYRPYSKEISYDYPDKILIEDGQSKYSILAHEYGHFIDDVGVFKNLHFEEVSVINQSLGLPYNSIATSASASDEFLKALREDKKYLVSKISDKSFRDDLFVSSASAGVQDAICGMFGTKHTKMIWQHSDRYYDRRYSSLKKLNKEKTLKKIYSNMGFDVSNKAKVKSIVRDYETASEMWANIMSAETCGGMELKYIKKYLPNSYGSFLNIMKELI